MLTTLLVGAALAADPPWAGVPLQALPSLGVGEPTLSHLGSVWRAPLDAGGFVDVTIYDSEQAALDAAARRVFTAAQHALPALGPDRWGDGDSLLLIRDRNVLILVRSTRGDALGPAEALRRALVVDAAGPDWQTLTVDGVPVAWDSCGRRRVLD